jgi:hypothetical protein
MYEIDDQVQNWVFTPSPPDVVGWKSGFASQFAPHDHVSVSEAGQYPVAA